MTKLTAKEKQWLTDVRVRYSESLKQAIMCYLLSKGRSENDALKQAEEVRDRAMITLVEDVFSQADEWIDKKENPGWWLWANAEQIVGGKLPFKAISEVRKPAVDTVAARSGFVSNVTLFSYNYNKNNETMRKDVSSILSSAMIRKEETNYSIGYVKAAALAALVLVVTLAVSGPSVEMLSYSSAKIPQEGISRGDDGAWTQERQLEVFGWTDSTELKGFQLKEAELYPVATAMDDQEMWMLQSVYEQEGHTLTLSHSQNERPLWVVLSVGEGEKIKGQTVYFGKDEEAGTVAAAWQRNGLTMTLSGDVDVKTLVKVVKQLLP